MNAELRRQHAAHKERRERINAARPKCLAITSPVVREVVVRPRTWEDVPQRVLRGLFGQQDAHVRAWERSRLPSYKLIIGAVSQATDVDVSSILTAIRVRRIAYARQIAMFLLVEDAKLSLIEAGRRLGGRDHSTILYGVRRVRDAMLTDPATAEQVTSARAIVAQLRGCA